MGVSDVTPQIALLIRMFSEWDSRVMYSETEFLYATLELKIYTKIPRQELSEVLKEEYTYYNILALITCIYGLLQAARCRFKEYIKTMTFKAVFNQRKIDPSLLYISNKLGTAISTVYVYETLAIGDRFF